LLLHGNTKASATSHTFDFFFFVLKKFKF